MQSRFTKIIASLAAFAALALGGSALAGAASNTTTTSGSAATQTKAPPAGQQPDPSKGGHQADGKTEQLLTGDTATKVKEAALAKVSGGTVLRVETDVDTGSPYEAHVQKSDGSQVVVYVDSSFNVTSVAAFGGPGGPGAPGA